ncbi:MAG: NYN domain-containing protein [Candidatus Gribaldobacteria bacterium]|nr:NYN domain-containing protein [Candidatus Gribaldobacteria bacterium]
MDIQKPKVKVYIDGANVFYTQKKLGRNLDWQKVKNYLSQDKNVIEYRYYVGIKEDDEAIKKYLKYLDKINFVIVSKPLKIIKVDKQQLLGN